MKLYLYEYVSNVSGAYHSGGGLVIITDGDPLEAWRAYVGGQDVTRWDDPPTEELPVADKILDVPGAEAAVHVFPDVGCC